MSIARRITAVRGGFSKLPEIAQQRASSLTSVQVPNEAPSVSILDRENRFSLINLVPENFQKILEGIPKEYFSYSETRLREMVNPDDTLNRLKLRFWDEWQISLLAGVKCTKISIASVYYGICTEEYFYENVLNIPLSTVWIVVPPSDFIVTMRDVLNQGLDRLKEIINLPLVTEEPILYRGECVLGDDGKPIIKKVIQRAVISEIRQLVSLLSDRVHGAVVQRLDVRQNSLNMDLSANAQDILKGIQEKNSDVLEIESADKFLPSVSDSELSNLESQLSKLTEVLDKYPEETENGET
jgi:hypothetical protein